MRIHVKEGTVVSRGILVVLGTNDEALYLVGHKNGPK